jgi:LPS sulfotransferase NodH
LRRLSHQGKGEWEPDGWPRGVVSRGSCFNGSVPTPATRGSYLICATPRSGSTLLCGLLQPTGIAGRPESYFRLPDEQTWAERWRLGRDPDGSFDYRDYVRAAIRNGSTENGVFGARVMWGTMDEIVAKLSAVYRDLVGADLEMLTRAFGRTRFVHLCRGDTVAQAVSWARAEQTGYWQYGDTVANEPHFDFDQVRGFAKMIDEHKAAWWDWFTSFDIRPHVVRYEELIADMVGVTLSVLDFLGLQLPDDRTIAPGNDRQADEINDEWVARYRAIAERPTVVPRRDETTPGLPSSAPEIDAARGSCGTGCSPPSADLAGT